MRYDALLELVQSLHRQMAQNYATKGCGACGARWFNNDGQGHFNGCAYKPLHDAMTNV